MVTRKSQDGTMREGHQGTTRKGQGGTTLISSLMVLPVKVVLKGYQIQRALASARTLCPFPEYCPVFHKGLTIASEDPDV
jgi:hypothetical protein